MTTSLRQRMVQDPLLVDLSKNARNAQFRATMSFGYWHLFLA
jgi:hypothetical protein